MPEERARINIYLDSPETRGRIRVAAARRGMSISAYCAEAIRRQLEGETEEPDRERMLRAARRMDRNRLRTGRIGIPVSELIREGRKD